MAPGTKVSTTKRSMLTGIVWMTAAKGFAQAISWAITIAVVRLLTPHDYGLMGMAGLFGAFVALFSEFGLGAAIVQKKDLSDEQLSRLQWIIAAINVLLFLILLLGAPLVAAYFREPRVTNIVRAMSLTFVMHAVGTPAGYVLQRRMAFREKASAEFAGSITAALATLVFAATGFGVWSLVAGTLVQQLTINALYCVYAPIPVRWNFSTHGLRAFFSFGGQVAASRLLWWVASNADYMVVGRVLGSVQLGFYSMAFQFSSVPIDKLVAIINQVAFPSFAAVQHDDAAARQKYLNLVSSVALLTFPMFVGLLLVADSAVALFFTAKWAPLIVPLKILCVVSCFRVVEILNAPLVVAKGQPKIVLGNSLAQAVILPAAVYLGARGGIQGVAVAWLVTRPFFFAFITRRALQVIGLSYAAYFGALKHAIVGCLIVVAVVVPVQAYVLAGLPAVVGVVVTVVLGGLVYVAYNLAFNAAMLTEGVELIRARRRQRAGVVPPPATTKPAVKPDTEPPVVVGAVANTQS